MLTLKKDEVTVEQDMETNTGTFDTQDRKASHVPALTYNRESALTFHCMVNLILPLPRLPFQPLTVPVCNLPITKLPTSLIRY